MWEFSKAVFFDMDGILYDSMRNHETTWQQCFLNVGIDFPAKEAYKNEGRTGKETIQLVFKQLLGREATPLECEDIYADKTQLMERCPQAPLLDGMRELIEALRCKGIFTGVVTGSKQPLLLDKLSADFGFKPHEIISAKDVRKGKPHPEPYSMALARSGFPAESCVVVENAPLGVRSAKAAGIFTIAVNTGILPDHYLLDEGCDRLFASTKELSTHWVTALEKQ